MRALVVLVLLAATSLEVEAASTPAAPWAAHLADVDRAIAQGDIPSAVRSWSAAHAAVRDSRRWEGWIAVGDAYIRLGEASGFRTAAIGKARRFYLTALFRARAEGSIEGVLRAARAFALLGDREVVAQCLEIADALAVERRDEHARTRIRDFARRIADESLAADRRR